MRAFVLFCSLCVFACGAPELGTEKQAIGSTDYAPTWAGAYNSSATYILANGYHGIDGAQTGYVQTSRIDTNVLATKFGAFGTTDNGVALYTNSTTSATVDSDNTLLPFLFLFGVTGYDGIICNGTNPVLTSGSATRSTTTVGCPAGHQKTHVVVTASGNANWDCYGGQNIGFTASWNAITLCNGCSVCWYQDSWCPGGLHYGNTCSGGPCVPYNDPSHCPLDPNGDGIPG